MLEGLGGSEKTDKVTCRGRVNRGEQRMDREKRI